ncbi:MAG: beta-ketoacyl-ACP synthase III [Anaerolineales bacterium]
MNRYAHVTGWGMAVPRNLVTNDDLAQRMDTSDEWIVARTGIRQRHIAAAHETTATLATRAAMRALERTSLRPRDLNLIIVATSSPEHLFPATACLVQDTLGASKAGAFDLSAACTGFLYGLSLAADSIRSGAIDNALVIGSETLSRLVDWEDRATSVLFGDGAGAFVLEAGSRPGGVLSSVLRSDGSGANLLSLPAGGSRMPTTIETVKNKQHTIHMNGREVFRFATRVMASATRESLENAGLGIEDAKLLVPHQANRRIIEAAARSLRIPMDRVFVNIDRYGNTSAASIPIAVCEAVGDGRIQPGDHVVMVAFGAGLTWGAQTLKWVAPERRVPIFRKPLVRLSTGLAKLRSWLRRLWRRLEALIFRARSGPNP